MVRIAERHHPSSKPQLPVLPDCTSCKEPDIGDILADYLFLWLWKHVVWWMGRSSILEMGRISRQFHQSRLSRNERQSSLCKASWTWKAYTFHGVLVTMESNGGTEGTLPDPARDGQTGRAAGSREFTAICQSDHYATSIQAYCPRIASNESDMADDAGGRPEASERSAIACPKIWVLKVFGYTCTLSRQHWASRGWTVCDWCALSWQGLSRASKTNTQYILLLMYFKRHFAFLLAESSLFCLESLMLYTIHKIPQEHSREFSLVLVGPTLQHLEGHCRPRVRSVH